MDGDGLDDWEMDDWEDEAFDEDVYDHSELELTADVEAGSGDDVEDGFGEEGWASATPVEDEEDLGLLDGGGPPSTDPAERLDTGGGPMGWSAWDVGTVFALGGWLADHHAERTAQQVAAALAERNVGRPASGTPLGAAHPPPPSGHPYQQTGGTLTVEDPVDPQTLFSELAAADADGRDLMIEAKGPVDLDRVLVLIISAVPWSHGPRFWVVVEENRGGFNPSRLIPVFVRDANLGAGVFASDRPSETVDAALWACEREGVPLREFHVTEKRPPSPHRA